MAYKLVPFISRLSDSEFEYGYIKTIYDMEYENSEINMEDEKEFETRTKGKRRLFDILENLGYMTINRQRDPLSFSKLNQSQALKGVPTAFLIFKPKGGLGLAHNAYVLNNKYVLYEKGLIAPKNRKIISIHVEKEYFDRVSKKLENTEFVSSSIPWKKVPGMGDLGKGPCAPLAISIVLDKDVHEVINELDIRYNKGKKPRRGRRATSADGATTHYELNNFLVEHGYSLVQFRSHNSGREMSFSINTLIKKGGLDVERMILWQASKNKAHMAAYVKGAVHDGWDSRRHRLIGVSVKARDIQKVQKAVEKVRDYAIKLKNKKIEKENRMMGFSFVFSKFLKT